MSITAMGNISGSW